MPGSSSRLTACCYTQVFLPPRPPTPPESHLGRARGWRRARQPAPPVVAGSSTPAPRTWEAPAAARPTRLHMRGACCCRDACDLGAGISGLGKLQQWDCRSRPEQAAGRPADPPNEWSGLGASGRQIHCPPACGTGQANGVCGPCADGELASMKFGAPLLPPAAATCPSAAVALAGALGAAPAPGCARGDLAAGRDCTSASGEGQLLGGRGNRVREHSPIHVRQAAEQ